MSCRRQPCAQSIQVRQADQHHHLSGVLGQPAVAQLGVAELPLDDAEEMLDPRPDGRIPPVAFLLAAGKRCPEAAPGLRRGRLLGLALSWTRQTIPRARAPRLYSSLA